MEGFGSDVPGGRVGAMENIESGGPDPFAVVDIRGLGHLHGFIFVNDEAFPWRTGGDFLRELQGEIAIHHRVDVEVLGAGDIGFQIGGSL